MLALTAQTTCASLLALLTLTLNLPLLSAQPSLSVTSSTKDLGNGVHVPGAIPSNLYEPLQHHLAFGKDYRTLYISWASFSFIRTPEVHFGTDPNNLNLTGTSHDSSTYPTSRTYNNHVKLMDLKPNTKYWYMVSYTNAAYAAYRPKYTFKTALPAGDLTPFSVAAFGDLGLMGPDGLSTRLGPLDTSTNTVLGANETNTIQSLLQSADSYDFIAHVGDIGYADYYLRAATLGYFDNTPFLPTTEMIGVGYESLKEQFFDQMQPVTANKPWMVSPGTDFAYYELKMGGNHEANCDNGGYSPKSGPGVNNYTDANCPVGQTNFTFYINQFRMPGPDSGGVGNFCECLSLGTAQKKHLNPTAQLTPITFSCSGYSYNYGMAHFISLDTETDLGHGLAGPIQNKSNNHNGPFGVTMNAQIDWLISDLQRVDRKRTPWVVVFLHRPWYTAVGPPATPPAWQIAFEGIFQQYNVDIYVQGHVHTYERFSPRFNGILDPNGYNNPSSPWPIIVGAAGHFDGLDTFTNAKTTQGWFGIDSLYGWSRLSFLDRQHMRLDYFASGNSSIVDSQTLFKQH
ncbi:BQ2448_5547 [Microbotryum intermedium]|uniref:Purple acid phosphatase n=1 Tax=Microbotryum intermedium TaxID=269621 RepID=A0A238F4G2_9BASI|nr:BQ2448_5547 [Microbotryum intermedium]